MKKQICEQTGIEFVIYPEDLEFLDKLSPQIAGKKISLPVPRLCPEERMRRRMAFRSELHLFMRKSDLSGKPTLSQFAPDSDQKVYLVEEWLSDAWDASDYAVDYNPNKSFFEQYDLFSKAVPKPARAVFALENSDYVNCCSYIKNCYLIAGANDCEDCYYGNYINSCKVCLDCAFITGSEFCYECVDCHNCKWLQESWNCHGCSESYFLHNCRNCKNCIASVNLVNAEYMILNRQYSKSDYFQIKDKLKLHICSKRNELAKRFEQHRLKYPYPSIVGEMNENSTGNVISNCRNSFSCFDVSGLEDCRYCSWFLNSKDSMDAYSWGAGSELMYETVNCGEKASNNHFCFDCYSCSNVMYSSFLRNCQNCFACTGLKRKEYCIFNKQYSKEKYEELLLKIISDMQVSGEWGKFFPMSLSSFPYNHSIAQDYYPLTKEAALELKLDWSEYRKTIGTDVLVPVDDLELSTPDICKQTFYCQKTRQAYKIIPQEYRFYRDQGIPLPNSCFESRHKARVAKRLPRKLVERKCGKTGQILWTSFPPERPEKVYEKSAYLQELY